ncbi:neurofilament medium polypeptide-like [Lytechinus pictus]|uniref:neurofilament medium polypeptide-like n=1 Tax=Lytechinus pictus TaxID=7653 RepID=UPI0030B9DD6C
MSTGAGSSFRAANNVLQKKWNQRTYQMHVAKKNGMRTKIDATSPKVFPHLQVNMKKLQAEEEKQAQIDHENRILLAKLTNIIRSGGQIDNWNFEYEAQPKTLHAPYKNREQERIDRENALLLKRLNNVKPQVNFDKMEDDYLMHNYFLAQKAQATKNYEVDLRGVDEPDKFVFYAKDRHANKEKTFVDGEIEETIEEPVEGEVRELTSAKVGVSKRLATRQQLKRRSTKLPLIGPERKKAEEKKKKDSVVKIATYNQKEEAAKLFKATKGMGNPEQILVQTLAKRQYQQRQDTMKKFEENYGLTLEEELKNNLNAEYDDIVEALLMTREELDAMTIRRALKGDDSLVEPIIEVLCTRSNSAIGLIREAYKKLYGVTLEDDITAEIKGKLKNLFLVLSKGVRVENVDVDEEAAVRDAEALRDAGDERWTPRSEKMSELLQSSSLLHFREVLLQYNKLTNSNLVKELEKSLFGDFKDAMLCLVKCMNSNTQFLAERIHASLTGEADDMTLIRIIITRSELDLPYIRRSYKKLYQQTLMEAIEQKCKASFKMALVQMVQVHGAFQKQDQTKEEEPGGSDSQEAEKQAGGPPKPSQQRPLKHPTPNTGAKVPASNPLVKSTLKSNDARKGTPGSPNRSAGAKSKQTTNSPGNSGKSRQAPGTKTGVGASAISRKTTTPPRKATPPKPAQPSKETSKAQPPTKKKVEEKSTTEKEDQAKMDEEKEEKKMEEKKMEKDKEAQGEASAEKETPENEEGEKDEDESDNKDGMEKEEKTEEKSEAEMKSLSGTEPTSEDMSAESEVKEEVKEEEGKVEEYGKEIEMKPNEDQEQGTLS